MQDKPVLIDLFCGAGGCTKGYQRAGFYVIGVDSAPQPRYCGDEFYEADALTFDLAGADAVHASPPCQAFTSIRNLGKGAGKGALNLIPPVRELLIRSGLPYVIENVPGAPLIDPVVICGSTLGLDVRRHRLFESNVMLLVPRCSHGARGRPIAVYGDHPEDSKRDNLNRARTLSEGQAAMDIDWMPWAQLTQAIPPAYTELIGHQLKQHVRAAAA